jgi:hypothetical protein
VIDRKTALLCTALIVLMLRVRRIDSLRGLMGAQT